MITIEGEASKRGVAIAVAAIVDSVRGIGGISPALLQEGIDALKRGASPDDYPEAVVITDSLALGAAVTLPGINAIGIASQSAEISPGDPTVPCVTDLPELLQSVSEGDIVIVDGNKGLVHIDPDPQTLGRYQQIDEHAEPRQAVFIASEHIPAKTQFGETVMVYAHAGSQADLAVALEQGADGLLVDLREAGTELAANILLQAAGKPIAFQLLYPDVDLVRSVMLSGSSDLITLLFPTEDHEQYAAEMSSITAQLVDESLTLDIDISIVRVGAYARAEEYVHSDLGLEESMLAIDLTKSAYLRGRVLELADVLPSWTGSRQPEDVILLTEKHIETVPTIVTAGGRAIAVVPRLVGAAKDAIRRVGQEGDQV